MSTILLLNKPFEFSTTTEAVAFLNNKQMAPDPPIPTFEAPPITMNQSAVTSPSGIKPGHIIVGGLIILLITGGYLYLKNKEKKEEDIGN